MFGRVVGGIDVLDDMEQIRTDKNDVPLEPITILKTIVYSNPFKELEERQAEEKKKKQPKLLSKDDATAFLKYSTEAVNAKNNAVGVGQYLKANPKPSSLSSSSGAMKSRSNSSKYGDFSNW